MFVDGVLRVRYTHLHFTACGNKLLSQVIGNN